MPLQPLTIDTLGDLDNGRAREVINQALAEAISDCQARGDECSKARKVVIQVEIAPAAEGVLEFTVQASCKTPALVTGKTLARVDDDGDGVRFQSGSADNPDQNVLPMMDDAGPGGGKVTYEVPQGNTTVELSSGDFDKITKAAKRLRNGGVG